MNKENYNHALSELVMQLWINIFDLSELVKSDEDLALIVKDIQMQIGDNLMHLTGSVEKND